MTEKIENSQLEIFQRLDELCPIPYTKAWAFYEGGSKIIPSIFYCFRATDGRLIPMDSIEKRKDLVIKDPKAQDANTFAIMSLADDLQKEYTKEYGKDWYTATFELTGEGQFNISFIYEKPVGSLSKEEMTGVWSIWERSLRCIKIC